MSVYLGGVTFPRSLKWLRVPQKIVGTDVETRDGSIVSIRVKTPSTDSFLSLVFDRVPWSTVETLMGMAETSSTFTLKPENSVSTTYTVRFSDKGVSDVESMAFGKALYPSAVEGYATDLWKGILNLIKVA